MRRLTIEADGASRGNPGPSAIVCGAANEADLGCSTYACEDPEEFEHPPAQSSLFTSNAVAPSAGSATLSGRNVAPYCSRPENVARDRPRLSPI